MTISKSKQIGCSIACLAALGSAQEVAATGTLDEALELDLQAGVSASSSAWICESVGSHDGVDVAVSPELDHEGSASFEISVEGPETISFWWKVSSEEMYDALTLSIDGTIVRQIAGEIAWTNEFVTVGAGSHVLRWEYSKDGSFTEGGDRGWVDDLRLASKSLPFFSYPNSLGSYVGEALEVMPQSGSAAVEFTFTGATPAWLNLDSKTGRLTGTATTVGEVTVGISARNSLGSSPSESITIRTAELGAGLETSSTGWHWAGAQPWYRQPAVTHSGTGAFQSGAIGDDGSSELRLQVTGPAIVRFWWRVDSEGGHDQLSFLIDGTTADDLAGQPAQIDDLVEWEQRSIGVPAGSHLIAWRYEKDSINHEGADAAWLDDVEIIDGSDPDGDGIASLTEVILGLDWKTPGGAGLQVPTELDGKLSWQITKGAELEGVRAAIEISYDLQSWSEDPLEILVDDDSRLLVRERQATPSKKKFVRVRPVVTGP